MLKPGTDQLNVVAFLETVSEFVESETEGIGTDIEEDVDVSEDMLVCLVSIEKVAQSALLGLRAPAYLLEMSAEYRT